MLLLDLGPGDTVVVPSFAFVTTALAFARPGRRILFCDIERETLGLDPAHLADAARRLGARCRADPLRGHRLRHRRASRGVDRPAATSRSSRTTRTACSVATAVARSGASAASRRSASTRRRTSSAARVARSSSTTTPTSTVRTCALRQGHQPPRRSCSARSTSTRGTTSDRRSGCATCSRPSSTASSSSARRSSPSGAPSSTATRRCSRRIADELGLHAARRAGRPRAGVPHVLRAAARPRDAQPVLESMRDAGVQPTFHYVPLHSSAPGADVRAREPTECPVTDDISGRLLRLPVPQQPDGRRDADRVVRHLRQSTGRCRGDPWLGCAHECHPARIVVSGPT